MGEFDRSIDLVVVVDDDVDCTFLINTCHWIVSSFNQRCLFGSLIAD